MKNISRFFVFLCSALFISSMVSAQGIDSMMGVYANQYPQQKLYVHFDKSMYRAGESVWFKAYIFSGFEPSDFSRNFFAELVDKDGNVVQRKVYPIVEASAAGNFDLPGDQISNLSFRAYTTWMLNFDTSFIFKKEITVIGNGGAATSVNKPATAAQPPIIKFFPEGGDLVVDLESYVAFKANDENGKPINVKGEIKNSKGETTTSFKAAHDGMGQFIFTPAANEMYTAYFSDETGKEYNAVLPTAKPSGVVLHMSNSGKKKIFYIKRSDEGKEGLSLLNVMAHMGQQIVYKAKVPMKEISVNSGVIPVEQLPSGILQFTVFNEKWEPLAERVVMVNNDNYRFDAELATPMINLGKRGKNIYELTVGDTALSNMSVAITDAQIGTKASDDNIFSGLLMSGDLKGYIHNPAYYFKNIADTTLQNLDLVMLTHGWRRYKWDDIVRRRKPFLKQPNDPALSLVAKVFGVNPSAPIRNDEGLTVILQMKDSSTQILQVPKTGPTQFSINNLMFYDTLKVFYQFQKDRRLASNTSVLFENGLYKGPKKVNFPAWPFSITDTIALKRVQFFADQVKKFGDGSSRVNVLQEVFVKTKPNNRANELDKKYASGLFAGGDATTFDFINDQTNTGYPNIFSYLQGRVAGLQISLSGANVSLNWRGSPTTTFLNEMQVDAQQIQSLAVSDIAYIKVFRPPFFGAMGGGAGGAIAIYTKKGGDQPVEPGKGLDRGTLTGYSLVKEFYSPNYSDPVQEVTADFRSTLYWNPFVFTDGSKQKAKFEFYNNDVTKAIRVVVEGVNEFGKLVRIEKVLQ
jgi:hypothetical protein